MCSSTYQLSLNTPHDTVVIYDSAIAATERNLCIVTVLVFYLL